MNGPIHFCTGYLTARALGYREHRFEPVYVAVAAYAPDFDMPLSKLSPFFAHGIWTHTLAGVLAMSVALSALVRVALLLFRPDVSLGYWKLLGLAILGGVTHLLLDAFTFYYSEGDATHHMYFWPLWNFPWHINTMFPGVSFTVRVWVEVFYSILVAGIIVLYQWAYRGQNPLRIVDPRRWFEPTDGTTSA